MAQVDNYTANVANKVYVLVLIALFERYLRLWAAAKFEGAEFNFRKRNLMDLVTFVASQLQFDIEEQRVRSAIQEALLVGNIVRHGEGWSMDEIREQAPHLIDRSKSQYVDLIGQETPDSEWVKIGPIDLERYVKAMIRFWGLVEKEPFAVTSVFVGES